MSTPLSKRKRQSSGTEPRRTRQNINIHTTARKLDKLIEAWRDVFFNEEGRLHLMLDFGTTKFGAVYARDATGSVGPLDVEIRKISLEDDTVLQPALLGFIDAGIGKDGSREFRVVHGAEVNICRAQGDILPENIFRNLKQAEPFINGREMENSPRAAYLKKVQQKHAELLARLQNGRVILKHKGLSITEKFKVANMKEVVCLHLKMLRFDIMHGLMKHSNADIGTIEELFSGDPDKTFGRTLRMGVAAPELWGRQRLVLYERLVSAGFPPQLEILSEAKCAAAAVLRRRFDGLSRIQGKISPTEIESLMNKTIMVVDRGGHTLDISTMRLVRVNIIDKKASLTFKTIISSTSTEDGGDRVTDELAEQFPDIFGPSFNRICQDLSVGRETVDDLVLIEGLLGSIERNKVNPIANNNREKIALVFDNIRELVAGAHRGGNAWSGKKVEFQKWRLTSAVRFVVDAILDENGPLLTHVRRTRDADPEGQIEIVLSGGGSKDVMFRTELNAQLNKHADMRGVSLGVEDHNAESLVCEGGIYLLVDPNIGDASITTRSYGIVHTAEYDPTNKIHQSREQEKEPMEFHVSQQDLRGKFQLPQTIDWLAPMGTRVRITSEIIPMSHQFYLDEGEEPDEERVIDIQIPIVSTKVAKLGSQNGWSAQERGIEQSEALTFSMKTKDIARLARNLPEATLGFIRFVDPDTNEPIPRWQLEFDYHILYRWAGMLQIFELHIPYGGYFSESDRLSRDQMYVARFQHVGECEFRGEEAGNSTHAEEEEERPSTSKAITEIRSQVEEDEEVTDEEDPDDAEYVD